MRISTAILIAILLGWTASSDDVVLLNGTVVDGSGNPRMSANVRIQAGVITAIGPFKPAASDNVIDVKGMIIAPGFIDLHGRSTSEAQILQGVTMVVLGQDGEGPIAVE